MLCISITILQKHDHFHVDSVTRSPSHPPLCVTDPLHQECKSRIREIRRTSSSQKSAFLWICPDSDSLICCWQSSLSGSKSKSTKPKCGWFFCLCPETIPPGCIDRTGVRRTLRARGRAFRQHVEKSKLYLTQT